MSKYGKDENGWLLVPVDPKAIPEGYEPVRVGWAKEYEHTSRSCVDKTHACLWQGGTDISCHSPFLIIRPIPKPIRLPLAIVPSGWWLRKNSHNRVFISEKQPARFSNDWSTPGHVYEVPPPIAKNLPSEWHALPWEQSVVQQKEMGEE